MSFDNSMEYVQRLIKPGSKLRVHFNDNNPNNYLGHVRAIVDDEFIVIRIWRRGQWRYRIDHVIWYATLHDGGSLTIE